MTVLAIGLEGPTGRITWERELGNEYDHQTVQSSEFRRHIL